MALVKRRPRVTVLVPRVVHPGESFEATFEVDVQKAVPIDSFVVTLDGRTRVLSPQGGYSIGSSPLALSARISGPAELAPGRHRFPCRFELPLDAPPTLHGLLVRITYALGAQIVIPWWLDVDRAFELTVVARPYDGPRTPAPLLYSSAPDGPTEREPHAEVSVADGVVEPDRALRGAVALGNVAFARYTGIRVTLTGWEHVLGVAQERVFGAWQIQIPLSSPTDGEPIPFDLRVPDVPPSMGNQDFRVRWTLDVTVTRKLGADLVVSLPITVLPRGSSAQSVGVVRAAPSVGNARTAAVWSEVAARAGMRFDGERLEARVGEVDVAIMRESAQGRPRLVAQLAFPSLGLELRGGPAGGLSSLWSTPGVLLGRGFRLESRDRPQLVALIERVEVVLGRASVRHFDDERLVLERAGAGVSTDPVRDFASTALAVAALLPKLARELPLASGIDAGPWRALAERLGAELLPARPSVRGELDGHAIEVAQLWAPGGVAEALRVTARSSAALAPRFVGAHLRDLPTEAKELCREWDSQETSLEISAGELCVKLPGTLADPDQALTTADRLIRLIEVLSRRAAYR